MNLKSTSKPTAPEQEEPATTAPIDTGLRIGARTYRFKLMHPLHERRGRYRLQGRQQRRYFVMPGDYVSDFTTQFGTFEPNEIRVARHLCQSAFGAGPLRQLTLVDAGCHIGNYSVEMGPYFGSILAIDAMSSFAHVARANLAWNGLAEKSSVVCVAVASQAGELSFHTDRMGNLGGTHMVQGDAASAEGTTQVQAQDLDSLLQRAELNRVAFIKLDVEGNEVDALAGAQQTIRQDQPLIQVEVDKGNLQSVMTGAQASGVAYSAWQLMHGNPTRPSLLARVSAVLLGGGNPVYLQRLNPTADNARKLPCVFLIPDALGLSLSELFPITDR